MLHYPSPSEGANFQKMLPGYGELMSERGLGAAWRPLPPDLTGPHPLRLARPTSKALPKSYCVHKTVVDTSEPDVVPGRPAQPSQTD